MNFKKILFWVLLSPIFVQAQSNEFVLTGEVPKDLQKVYLLYYDYSTNNQVLDSAVVKGGKFNITGEIEGACYAGLYFRNDYHDKQGDLVNNFWFNLNQGETHVDAVSSKQAKIISGGLATQKYMAMQNKINAAKKQLNSTEYSRNANVIDSLEQVLNTLRSKQKMMQMASNEEVQKIQIDFIKNEPQNTLSILLLESFANNPKNLSMVESLLNGLSDELKLSYRGKKIANSLRAEKLKIGALAFDFSQSDVNGKIVRLSDFRGKYVLIDFWASWCVPCRKENPFVLKAYQNFKNKNFEIIGISLDNNKENWLKAIQDDQLPWVNLSDLKGWRNEVSSLYGVKGIPTNYLIDPNGLIVAKNLRGEELEKVLNSVLK